MKAASSAVISAKDILKTKLIQVSTTKAIATKEGSSEKKDLMSLIKAGLETSSINIHPGEDKKDETLTKTDELEKIKRENEGVIKKLGEAEESLRKKKEEITEISTNKQKIEEEYQKAKKQIEELLKEKTEKVN